MWIWDIVCDGDKMFLLLEKKDWIFLTQLVMTLKNKNKYDM